MKDYTMTIKLRNWASADKDAIAIEFYTEEPYAFIPGQYVRIKLINPLLQDKYGDSRIFNITTSPKHRNQIGIVTRLRDTAFKKNLRDLPIGTPIAVSSAMGNFILHENTNIPAVFIVGGTGIAPVISMLYNIHESKSPYKIYLFYSNKTTKRAVFLKEIEVWSQKGVITKYVHTLTQTQIPPAGFLLGRINEHMIANHLSEDQRSQAIFYISGPWGMGDSMHTVLKNIGISDDRIRIKEFDLNWLSK